ncbi:MAG: zinc ribbon domain-containing protein [Planctomycetaceae bacterium]|nr:zinc ribbon domain-containing protein [Planctomycetaceae bacterium]
MPTYDYNCDACDHSFEVFESISVQPQTKCPKCKKKKLRRLFGAGAGLVFKGSGFYQTDYRSESYKNAASADKAPSESSSSNGDSGKKSQSKSEAKPAAKSEGKSPKSE